MPRKPKQGGGKGPTLEQQGDAKKGRGRKKKTTVDPDAVRATEKGKVKRTRNGGGRQTKGYRRASTVRCSSSLRTATQHTIGRPAEGDREHETVFAMVKECVGRIRLGGGRDARLGRAARSLMENLRENRGLLTRVMDGEVDVEHALTMPLSDMMCEDQRKALAEQRRRVLTHKRGSDGAGQGHDEGSTTDIFRCPVCKTRRTTYYQMQTRSSDEPMTTFITCVSVLPGGGVCGHKWSI